MTNPLSEQNAGDIIPKIATTISATIASGATISGAIDLGGCSLVGIVFPAIFTGTSISFKASNDGVNFYPMVNTAGVALSVTFAVNSWVGIVPSDFAGVKQLEIVSNGTEAATRQIDLITRDLS